VTSCWSFIRQLCTLKLNLNSLFLVSSKSHFPDPLTVLHINTSTPHFVDLLRSSFMFPIYLQIPPAPKVEY